MTFIPHWNQKYHFFVLLEVTFFLKSDFISEFYNLLVIIFKQIKRSSPQMSLFFPSTFTQLQNQPHEYNFNSYESFRSSYPTMKDQKACMIQTQANDDGQGITSRSKKTCADSFESSFQINFQYEHLQALQNKVQNFVESISGCSEKILESNLKEMLILDSSLDFNDCHQAMNSETCRISPNEKIQFRVDLKYEKKLKEFLDQISKKYTPQFAGQLIALANFVWINYVKVASMRFFQEQLKEWAENLSQKFQAYKSLLHTTGQICFQNDENEAFPNFEETTKQFTRFYFVTIALIIEQYFENPYLKKEKKEQKSFKRFSSSQDFYSSDQFSELQESNFGGKKRLKF